MTRKNITVNAIENEIVISKAFYKKASTYGTEEYKLLKKVMEENKGFDIVFKKINKESHKDLTFERMERYIKLHANSEENLREFEKVKELARSKKGLYPLTKKWFLAKFEDYKGEITENEISYTSTQNEKVA